MQYKKSYWRYLAGTVFIILILGGTHHLVFRWILNKTIEQAHKKWNLSVAIGNYKTRGITGASFQEVMVKYSNGDTLLWADSIEIKMKFLPLFVGNVYLAQLKIHYSSLHLNLQQLKVPFKASNDIEHANVKEYSAVFNIINRFFKILPTTCTIDSLSVFYCDSADLLAVNIRNFIYWKRQLKSTITISDNSKQSRFTIAGEIIPRQQYLLFSLHQNTTDESGIPYLQQRWGLVLSFQRAKFEYHGINATSGMVNTSVGNLTISHRRLAEQPVHFDTASFSLVFGVGKNYWQIDSTSQIGFNGFYSPIYIRYEKDTVSSQLTFAIPKIEFSAQKFFDALPKGAFKRIVGIKASGNLSFSLRAEIPFGKIDSLYLCSRLEKDNFCIKNFGLANLAMLNDTFTVHRHEPGMPPVAIRVDTLAKTYTRLRDISKYLIYAVLTAEDGSFFYHRGFNEEAFARSLAENIRKKRFARGASTITMQLVRNVFLSRNKTLSRKFEEILLTWMLENSHIVTKERMLEIYFNIIEWGPNIYGIQQAAKFYFNKKPSQLTLQESIFLAAIIPSPKYFRYTFVSNGTMKDGFQGYFQRIAQIMLSRNQISPTDTVGLNHWVKLSGEAQKFLADSLKNAVTRSDTTFFDPTDDF